MAGVLSRWPWRMGLIWLGLLFVLLAWLPRPYRSIPSRGRTSLLGISPDGRFVAVANDEARTDILYGRLATIDLSTGSWHDIPTHLSSSLDRTVGRVLIRGHRLWVEGVVSPSPPDSLAAYDLTTGQELKTNWVRCIGGLSGLSLSQDGTRALTLNFDRGPQLSVWDVDAERRLCSIDDAGTDRCLNESGTLVATVSREIRRDLQGHDLRWSVYDATTGQLKAQRTERAPPSFVSQQERDSGFEVDTDESVNGLQSPSGYWQRDSDRSDRIHFGDDDRTILSGNSPGSSIWHWQTGLVTRDPRYSSELTARQRLATLAREQSRLWSATPDGRWGIAASDERTWRDAVVLRLSSWFPAPMAGTRLDGGVVRLWNVAEDRVVLTLAGMYDDVALSDSGNCLVRLRDRTLQVWSIPPRLPWIYALPMSLIVPAIWLLRRRSSFRAADERTAPELAPKAG